MKSDTVLPQRREKNLVVQELPEQMLVYDEREHKAHYLNHTTALVWKHCDGQARVKEVADSIHLILGKPVGIRTVKHAVAQLESFGLLEIAI